MNNPDTGALLPVTQVDREAAWPHRPDCYRHMDQQETRQNWDAGVYDHIPVIRAFARHRHQSGRTGAGEACWLIERRCNPPQWSVEPSPTGVGAFYSDIHRAHRFATKQNAVEAMRRMSITPEERGEYFVSEHVWIEHD